MKNAYFYKTGLNNFILCKFAEKAISEGFKKIYLLESAGTYKEGEKIQTKDENIITIDVSIISRIAKKAGYTLEVNPSNCKEILNTLAVSYSDILADELAKLYKRAVNSYTSRGDVGDRYYKSLSDKLDSILALLDIQVDYSGLYPTFELTRNGKHLTEYSTSGALKQYNDFWGFW